MRKLLIKIKIALSSVVKAEVDSLKGDYSKAKKILKWKPKNNINSLVKDMISFELDNLNDK